MKTKYKIISIVVLAMLTTVFYLTTTSSSNVNDYETASPEDATKNRYELVWQDDFDSPYLDLSKWSLITRGESRWRRHMSTNRNLYEIGNGFIRLFCKNNHGIERNDTARVLTGGISTEKKFLIGYGKVEVRARMRSVMGCWPAIWLVTDKYSMTDPRWGEIDIMEHYNLENTVEQTAHNNHTHIQKAERMSEHQSIVPVNCEEWNTYTVEILKDRLIFSVNDRKQLVYKNRRIHGQFPYGAPSFLRIDMQWATQRAKRLDTASLPTWMDVDWVKVYKLK